MYGADGALLRVERAGQLQAFATSAGGTWACLALCRTQAAMRLLLAALLSLAWCVNISLGNEFYETGARHGTDKARTHAHTHAAAAAPALLPLHVTRRPLLRCADAHTAAAQVTGHAYHHSYYMFLRWMRHKHIKLLEIGLGCTMNTGSASIMLWQDYFKDLDLWMADIDTVCAAKVQNTTKNTILIGDQGSEADLLRWVNTTGGGFDIIVDDGSHSPRHQLESFRVLFQHALKPGGIYFIEDIESPQRPICNPYQPEALSRDKILYWIDQLLIFPRHADVDLPPGLQSITCQRESCAFHKCPADAIRCP